MEVPYLCPFFNHIRWTPSITIDIVNNGSPSWLTCTCRSKIILRFISPCITRQDMLRISYQHQHHKAIHAENVISVIVIVILIENVISEINQSFHSPCVIMHKVSCVDRRLLQKHHFTIEFFTTFEFLNIFLDCSFYYWQFLKFLKF